MPDPFTSLDLRPELLEALDQVGYTEMTPVQAGALPPTLAGADVVGQARTGSGKTAAYGLGLLQTLDPDQRDVHALVLCPTRELADQVTIELRRLAARLPNVRAVSICGGRPVRAQTQVLQAGVHVVVGTPGRVRDHLDRGTLTLAALRVLVLDEADRMLDMGFSDQVHAVVADCPTPRQTLLFSATFPDDIARLSQAVQRDPQLVVVDAQVPKDQLQQYVYHCDPRGRGGLVVSLLAHFRPDSALLFCETRNDCDALTSMLQEHGAAALALHGGLEQRDRDDVLVQFQNGSVRLLVATDVAARGLDVEALPAVIVTELSPEPANHIHRIGRTGRVDHSGLALTMVSGPVEEERLRRTQDLLGYELPPGPALAGGADLDFLAADNRTVLILSGRKDKLRKGDVLGALVKDAGIPADAIGRIDLRDRSCAVAVAFEHATQAVSWLRRGRVKNKRVRAVLL